MPRLVKSNSGSGSGGDSSGSFSASNEIAKDSNILRGAEILRRQLSDVVMDPHRHHPRNPEATTTFDRDDWNPWRTPTADVSNVRLTRRQQQQRPSNLYDDEEEDTVETMDVLQRAKALYQSMSFSSTGSRSRASDSNKNNNNQIKKSKSMTKASSRVVVDRVTDMDNSTFDTSKDEELEGGGGTYLPNRWLSDLMSPALKSNGSSNGSDRSGELTPSLAPTPIPSPLPALSTEEEEEEDNMETSTLDFLANLHVQEEDDPIPYFDDSYEEADAYHTMTSKGREKVPRVTAASGPFRKMISPLSYIYGELSMDQGFRHAVSAGNLWQSLCSQHVRFPALWWDGTDKPTCGPPMGVTKKHPWTYLGRHRVQGDRKLNSLIGNRGSSGRLLLHLVVRDVMTLEPIEDICCGCFHPNARGVRTTERANPRMESCRDIWIAHRRRDGGYPSSGSFNQHGNPDDNESTIESLLKHQLREQNEKRLASGGTAMSMCTPLGSPKQRINNENLRTVFGAKPPLFTVFVDESELFELFQSCLDGSTPASVVLLRRYLRYRIG